MATRQGDLQPIRGPDDFTAAFDVSRETIARLTTYEKLLRQWQKAVNLVAPSTLDAIWHRHFADCAQLLPLAPAGTRCWVDLGSGAGFPGLVVAIMLAGAPSPRASPTSPPVRPARGEGRGEGQQLAPSLVSAPHPNPLPIEEWGEGTDAERGDRPHVVLIESDTRKCAFLREVVRQTGVLAGTVDILSTRAESVRTQVKLTLPRVVCTRALAPLDKLLALAAPLSPPGTTGLHMKGKEAAKELQMAEMNWKFNVELVPSVTDTRGRIAVISNLERKAKD